MQTSNNLALERRINLAILATCGVGIVLTGVALIGTTNLFTPAFPLSAHSLAVYAVEAAPVVLIPLLLSIMLSQRLKHMIAAPLQATVQALNQAITRASSQTLSPEGANEIALLKSGLEKLVRQFDETRLELHATKATLETVVQEYQAGQAEIEKLKRESVALSRQAGMAEIATGVLHNVANVVNSIRVSATMLENRTRDSRVEKLKKAVDLLLERREDLGTFLMNDEKGRMLPAYLETVAVHLGQDQAALLQEMDQLSRGIEHITEIIAVQQSYARLCGVSETLEVNRLVEDAVRLNLGAFERHGVTLVRDYAPVPPITVEKHKVLQILVNLMRNAKYAMEEFGPPEKRLVLSITADGPEHVAIAVRDNGIGILPENLAQIFEHGFTTKKDGHGFGLHSGALAAKDLGGQLAAFSEGIGAGATFRLKLPIKQPKPARKANDADDTITES